ncbi:MAG: 3-oxoacyl-[acyl-carrier-protein] synthase III C-terminal domain-containing protein, partial [Xanthomonadales bacterium]
MKFKNVVIQSLTAIDPPIRITSIEIEQQLQATFERLGIRDNLLEEVSGIGARRFWENGTLPSDAATLAADTKVLLSEGLKLASKTFLAAKIAFGWVASELDQFIIHQVSKVHTDSLVKLLGLDPEKVHAIYPEMGNVGPASVPIVL